MGSLQPGSVVLAAFPYSDLSGYKMRPALVLAHAEFGDLILCQITSRSYTSKKAIEINHESFAEGTIIANSFVRPDKLFTTSSELITKELGSLNPKVIKQILTTVKQLFD